MGAEVLPPIIADIRRQHPEIELELVLTNEISDILKGEADIAVRMSRPTQNALVARKIGMLRDSIYAHSDYLARSGYFASDNEADMRKQTLIGFDHETPFITKLIQNFGIVRGDCAIRTDNDLARLALIRAGVGIGLVPDCVADRDPNLVRLSPKYSLMLELWLAMHEDHRGIARIRAVFDILAAGLKPFVQKFD
jgi:DNA-binding transcriptional LysR family regulator